MRPASALLQLSRAHYFAAGSRSASPASVNAGERGCQAYLTDDDVDISADHAQCRVAHRQLHDVRVVHVDHVAEYTPRGLQRVSSELIA